MIPNSRQPSSWEKCRLGDVVDYGTTQKAEPDEIPADAWVLELEDIEKDTSKVLQHVTFAQRRSKSTKNRFAAGDVLYGKLRPYLNKVVRAAQDGYCTTEIIPLKPSEAIDGGYLFYWLKHPTFLEYVTSVSHGLNMPRLGTEAGKEAPLILAPLNEQKRIADKLDAVLARADACRERLDRVPAILKRFRQAVLAAATSGKLTEEWRAIQGVGLDMHTFEFSDADAFRDYVFPQAWGQARLSDIASVVGGVTKDAKKQLSEYVEVPYLRVANVQRGFFDLTEIKTIRVPQERLVDLLLKPGDILFNEGGDIDKLGRGWVWSGEIEPCIFQNHVFRARLNDRRFSPRFFSWYGNSRGYDYFLSRGKQTTNLASINRSVLSALPVPLPPAEEQDEIVRRVAALLAYADRLDARYAVARAQVERLTPVLLAKAFCGELVPQDPNDEPASVLLERIRASRTAAGEKPPRKVRTERKPMTTKLTTDALKEIIRGLPTDQFTFDDLRRRVSADYETLKDVVFALLSEAPASVEQVFDTEAKTMRLARIKR